MTTCIFFHPDAYTATGPQLKGRHVAGASFLRGFFNHSAGSRLLAQVEKPEHAQAFLKSCRAAGVTKPLSVVEPRTLSMLSEAGVVHHPGPAIGKHALQRAAFGHGAWSITGITHTTSSAAAMDALAELLTAPVQPWDAVICTSTAVKSHVERLLQAQVDFLQDRLGITRLVLPQLPVIPLGIHTQDFVFSQAQQAEARNALAADEKTLVVLFMGRLSFHAKAHPLAMYQALEAAARATGKTVVLVECGWHANDYIKRAYEEAAKAACPSVRVRTLDGRKTEDRLTAWAGADVFCSLSDNIQETFGIAPIEAMAAGLPVVVSDWDGYKDTVRHGVDGFRIATIMPGAGLGSDLALRHALEVDTYDMYCGLTCSLVAVDAQATAAAFIELFQSRDLRENMGAAGRQRAQEVYDWKVVIGRYEDLWAQLNVIRQAKSKELKRLPYAWPARMDPFHAFAAYPTFCLTPDTLLELAYRGTTESAQRLDTFRQLAMVDFAKSILPGGDEVQTVLAAAASGPQPAANLVAQIPPERQPFVFRTLTWLVKLGVLKLTQ